MFMFENLPKRSFKETYKGQKAIFNGISALINQIFECFESL